MGMKKAINENFNGVEIYKFQLRQGVNATSTEHLAINYGKINYWDEETNSLKKIDNSRNNYLESIINADPVTIQNYRTYKDAVQNSPVDGTSGSPALALSVNSASPISGEADIQIVKSASNLQGEGVSVDFTIERKDLAKILQLEANIRLASGTYTKGDLRFYIIQDPNGTPVVIEPINTEIETGATGVIIKHLALFQTHATILNYRLCIHVATTSTNAYTLDFNNLKIWEQTKTYGAFISDWKEYTPTLLLGGSLYNVNFRYRQVGSNLEIIGRATITTSASEFRISLPDGLSVSNILAGNYNNVGTIVRDLSDLTLINIVLAYGGQNYITCSYSPTQSPLNPANSNLIFNSGETFAIEASIPIQGWGSNMLLSSEYQGTNEETSGFHYGVNEQTVDLNNTIKFNNTRGYNNHYNPITGVLTIPANGDYHFDLGQLKILNGYSEIRIVWINENGSNPHSFGTTLTNAFKSGGSILIKDLKRGQLVKFITTEEVILEANGDSYFCWHKVNKSNATFAKDEVVVADYYNSDGLSVADATPTLISYNAKDIDTHNIYNSVAKEFNIPVSGYYDINVVHLLNPAVSGYSQVGAYIDNNAPFYGTFYNFTASGDNYGWSELRITSRYFKAGSKLSFKIYQNSGNSLNSYIGSYNRVTINKIG